MRHMRVTSEGGSGVAADQAKTEAREAKTEIELLRADMERLLLITEALWSLLKEQHEYSDDQLFKRVLEIDLRDGRLDGRVAPSAPENCPHCQRVLPRRGFRCMFCGKPVKRNLFDR